MIKGFDIIFYGNIGVTKGVIGGGEYGNRKTISILQKNNYRVKVLEKPYLLNISILRSIIAPFQFFYKILLLIIKSTNYYTKSKIFHLSGIYCNLIFFENLFIRVANSLNFKTIYEIRAGGMIEAYINRSIIYKKLFISTIKNADSILCQGLENCNFLLEKFRINAVYYPNYMEDQFVNPENLLFDRLETEIIRVIFVGRLTPSKRIDLIIDIANELKKYGLKFHINIVGNGDLNYLSKVKQKCHSYCITDSVFFHGKLSITEISKLLMKQHFFLFPTQEKREGHSNSLTEAMNFGVVPIASNNGFNKTIINNSELIIDNFEAINYAYKIKEIFLDRELWLKYSDEMHTRIKDNFTESIVSKTLLSVYSDLIQMKYD